MQTPRTNIAIVRTAAVFQGLALVVVPTISTVLTDPKTFGLSALAYGTLFVPQSILAVIVSFGGALLSRRFGARTTLQIGFVANAVAMLLMTTSALFESDRAAAYGILLCATSCLGVGFALVTPTLNVLAEALEPDAADRAVLIVNALLGGSAAVAPLLLIAFVGLGFWWGLPLLCAFGMLVLLGVGVRMSYGAAGDGAAQARTKLPIRVGLFGAFAFVYGLCEQLNGSWAPIYMTKHLGASVVSGSIALALFWAVATGSRVAFAVSGRILPTSLVFCVLPIVLAGAFAALALLPAHATPLLGTAAFALAGLGVSALLPLVLSYCARSVPEAATSATGVVFAAYLVGYGIAAFGVGPLLRYGASFSALDGSAVATACVLAALAYVIVHKKEQHA